MLDIKMIRERPDFVRQRLATREAGDEALIEKILPLQAEVIEVADLEGLLS